MRRAEASEPRQATAKRICSRRRRSTPGRRWTGAGPTRSELAAAEDVDGAARRRVAVVAVVAVGAGARRAGGVVPSLSTPSTTSGHTR